MEVALGVLWVEMGVMGCVSEKWRERRWRESRWVRWAVCLVSELIIFFCLFHSDLPIYETYKEAANTMSRLMH
jgi:uncharacterized membrane protein HdeD (DUF308 family)